jgi:hypothetical protein
MRQLLMGRSREGYLGHHGRTSAHYLVEDLDVAGYIAEVCSHYSGNDGGDNDGSDEPATESDGPSDTGIETLTSKYMEEMTMRACSESLLNQL